MNEILKFGPLKLESDSDERIEECITSSNPNEEEYRMNNINCTINVFNQTQAANNNAITSENIRIKFDDTFRFEEIVNNNCEQCLEIYVNYCLKCFKLSRILDTPVEFGVQNRAKKTLPKNIFEIKSSRKGNNGIFALETIPSLIILGPFHGSLNTKNTNIETEKNSNWMRYINSASDSLEQNLRAFQYNNTTYFRSIKQIDKGEELLIFYGIDLNSKDGECYKPPVENEDKDIYACVSCCLGFDTETYLMNHKEKCPFDTNKDEISSKIIHCSTCQLYLAEDEFLNGHEVSCTKIKKSYLASLGNGNDTIHENKEKFKCPICNESLSSKRELQSHKRVHADKKFTCPACNKKFAEMRSLKRHELTHTGENQFFCTKCDFGTVYKSTLKYHIKNVHVKEKSYVCNTCPFKTNDDVCTTRHIRMHLGISEYKCDVCEKEFRLKSDLVNHKRTHSDEKNFLCSQCEKTFKSHSSLNDHIFYFHSEKPHQCDHCNYKSTTKESFDRHMKNRHPDGGVDKKFKCTQCKYQTNDRGNYNKHVNNHNGYRPFVCEICEKGFLLKNDLRKHIRMHSRDKDYKCHDCGKSFASKQTLITHVTLHTGGDKKLICNQCNFQTNREKSLYLHKVKAHES